MAIYQQDQPPCYRCRSLPSLPWVLCFSSPQLIRKALSLDGWKRCCSNQHWHPQPVFISINAKMIPLPPEAYCHTSERLLQDKLAQPFTPKQLLALIIKFHGIQSQQPASRDFISSAALRVESEILHWKRIAFLYKTTRLKKTVLDIVESSLCKKDLKSLVFF